MLIQPTVSALNHLLTQNGWALGRLARFGGKTVRFDIAPFSFIYTIREDGSLQEASDDVSADACCTISPVLLPFLAVRDEAALKQIGASGDAALLAEVFFLIRNLQWDAAEDLSRFTGDIAAERIVSFARDARRQVHDTALNLSQAATEYWTEERPLLAKPQQLSAFAREVDKLHYEAGQLERRIQALFPGSSSVSSRGQE